MRPIAQTRLFSFALAAMLAAMPAVAQQQTGEGPAETDAAPQSDPLSDLSRGEPVDEEGQPLGEEYVLEASGDWTIVCIRTQVSVDPCSMRQLLKDAEGNNVATVDIIKVLDGGDVVAAGRLVTPLETLLTQQITMSVDGGAGRRYPFQFCTTQGCIARVGFGAADLNAFKRGNAGTMTIVPALAPDQKVNATMSLAGFTAGFDRLEELTIANAEAIKEAREAQGAN